MIIHTLRVGFKTHESKHTQVCVYSSYVDKKYLDQARAKVKEVALTLAFIESEQWSDNGKKMLSSATVESI